ncbi:c-type cytochrome [Rhodoplanes sp. TEM]|uniref:C-type cytochrome n=1 Tax=Rhodoplanes tepidamans TaxID=200616 RepID=A0ABT5J5Y2_RHOTP|nr:MULTISPECIES: c-type cytochrome [Rhodoplanes]MDC7785049.1 c-type cytochrome [Rhodoplanes tepidamans]MDC7982523.1 c-type cytochrome [Rhodoplanes sp. TEM]MDQ0356537.1 mono/diheme cytochrome c family protein [Rhodoplanes tepidamans]
MRPVLVCSMLAGWLAGCGESPTTDPEWRPSTGGAAARGRLVVERVGCGVCHVIPRVAGPRGTVGPSLAGFGSRTFVAGTLPNRPDVLADFVRDAPSLVPRTAMPPMPLDRDAARDVASFLHTLR